MRSTKTGNKTLNKKLEKFFILAIFIPIIYMGNSWYQAKNFKNSPLSSDIQNRINKRQTEVLALIRLNFNYKSQIPLIISDEFDSRLYGLTAYKEGKIKIYLNKKRFKESENYMIDEVIPHEYAHAMVFVLGKKAEGDGHTKLWQKICRRLDGKNCERYVDGEEIVKQKMHF